MLLIVICLTDLVLRAFPAGRKQRRLREVSDLQFESRSDTLTLLLEPQPKVSSRPLHFACRVLES